MDHTNHNCPVLNLPQDESEKRERKEHLSEVWEGTDLSYEEIESKYSWWDAVCTAVEIKNGIKPNNSTTK